MRVLTVLLAAVINPLSAQTWQAVPLRSPAQAAQGVGGEGGQWPQALAIDGSGNFLLFGTDVGGIYRSLDGGANWEPANVGYTPRGTSGFAIDPNNSDRALAVGANDPSTEFHGLYLTTNRAASWTRPTGTMANNYSGYRDVRDQVAFAKNVLLGGASKFAYWSAPDGKLYWSQDGGASWAQRNAGFGNGFIKVNPASGAVYVGTATGLHRSTNQGSSFSNRLAGAVQGLDAVGNRVWVSKTGGVWRSIDSAGTFTKLAGTGLPAGVPLRNVRAHPADVNRLLVVGDHGEYDKRIYVSTNGGTNWSLANYDNSGSFIPYNARLQLFAWHPINTAVAHSFGGDWITKSVNGGLTWQWNANGYGGVVSGRFNFQSYDANQLMLAIQDYNGASTTDLGATWTYEPISGQPWGGFAYGGGAMYFSDTGERTYWAGEAESWGAVRTLKIRRTGWGTGWFYTTAAGGGPVQWGGGLNNGVDVSLVDPLWSWTSFAANWRSTDRGHNWSPMSGCDGVLTFSQVTKDLFGVRMNGTTPQVVKSVDRGATWQPYGANLAGPMVSDVAVGVRPGGGERVFIAHDGMLFFWDTGISSAWTLVDAGLERDQWGWHRIRTVATDPQNLALVYVGSSRDVFSTRASVQRSTNSGVVGSWTTLTVNSALTPGVKDGGREALHIRVHPVTREAWVVTSCYGVWKIGAP